MKFPQVQELLAGDDLLQKDRDWLPSAVVQFVERVFGMDEIGELIGWEDAQQLHQGGVELEKKERETGIMAFTHTERRQYAQLAAILVAGGFCEAAAHARNCHMALHTTCAMQVGMYARTGSLNACEMQARLPFAFPSAKWATTVLKNVDVETPWKKPVNLAGNILVWFDNLQWLVGSSRTWDRLLKVDINTAVHFLPRGRSPRQSVQYSTQNSPHIWFNRHRHDYGETSAGRQVKQVMDLTMDERLVVNEQWQNHLLLALMTWDGGLEAHKPDLEYTWKRTCFRVTGGTGVGGKRGRERLVVDREGPGR